jgi:hypothetical protein
MGASRSQKEEYFVKLRELLSAYREFQMALKTSINFKKPLALS